MYHSRFAKNPTNCSGRTWVEETLRLVMCKTALERILYHTVKRKAECALHGLEGQLCLDRSSPLQSHVQSSAAPMPVPATTHQLNFLTEAARAEAAHVMMTSGRHDPCPPKTSRRRESMKNERKCAGLRLARKSGARSATGGGFCTNLNRSFGKRESTVRVQSSYEPKDRANQTYPARGGRDSSALM